MEEENKAIGSRIAEIRKLENITQAELASKTSIPTATLGNYERGDRTIPAIFIDKVATALQVPSWLISKGIFYELQNEYSLEFFINADYKDLQNYYADEYSVKSEEAREKYETEKEQKVQYIHHMVTLIGEIDDYEELDYLCDFINREKNIITNKFRLDKLKNNPTDSKALKFDPFDEMLKKHKEIKKADYKVYFPTTIEGQLHRAIKQTDKNSELRTTLQDILDKIHEDRQNKDFFEQP